MTLDVLQKDMVKAIKEGDRRRKSVLSALIGAVKNLAIAENQKDSISDDIVDRAVLKEQKMAEEQVRTCPETRDDLLKEYYARLMIIGEYAPAMMSRENILDILKTEYTGLIAGGNKGTVMKTVMPVFKGKADNRMVAECVSELCSQNK